MLGWQMSAPLLGSRPGRMGKEETEGRKEKKKEYNRKNMLIKVA